MNRVIERDDIQGGVLRGYGHNVAAYWFVSVDDPRAGRRLLGVLADQVQSAREWTQKPSSMLNIAVSAAGLSALGVPEKVRTTFAPEFLGGMRARAERLGDVGPADPARWEPGLGDGRGHVLLMVHAADRAALSNRVGQLHDVIDDFGDAVSVVHEQPATSLHTQREHFGFGDGFAQPALDCEPEKAPYRGLGVPTARGGWRRLKTGEILLGHEDEDGELPAAPAPPFGYNSTYLVYRKLHQNVATFREALRTAADGYPGGLQKLAAKIVGRWPDGTPLMLSPDAPDERLHKANDFRYADDRDGRRCPLGAHIRRANPATRWATTGNSRCGTASCAAACRTVPSCPTAPRTTGRTAD